MKKGSSRMTGTSTVFRLTTVSRLAFGFAGLGCAIALCT
jgi:hypothetical protein